MLPKAECRAETQASFGSFGTDSEIAYALSMIAFKSSNQGRSSIKIAYYRRQSAFCRGEGMSSDSIDRNLLAGVLALQFGLVNRERLSDAMVVWLNDKSQSLDEIFVRQGALNEYNRMQLLELVGKHFHGNVGDLVNGVASIASIQGVMAAFGNEESADTLVHPSYEFKADGNASTINSGRASGDPSRFRILRPHARGGLGEVSVAFDNELSREVALKEIQPRFAHDDESRARFVLEAQITGGLEHPGIVPVYGLGTYVDGRPYYAMRFIRGESLKEGIQKFYAKFRRHQADTNENQRLPAVAYKSSEFRQLLGRFVDVCNALAYAHARGVLHRDLKPANIMLGNYGETLVVDWGLAKATGKSDDSVEVSQLPFSASGSAETFVGNAIGTPGYMSPEQAGGRVDLFGSATDIYGLGATLFHILTGRAPHNKLSDLEANGDFLKRIQHGDFPKPRELNSAIPKPLDAICMKAMAVEPKNRYSTALELEAEIEHWLADEPVTTHKESLLEWLQRASRKNPGVSAALAMIVLLVTALWTFYRIEVEKDRAARAIEKSLAISLDTLEEICSPVANDEFSNLSLFEPLIGKIESFSDEYLTSHGNDDSLQLHTARVLHLHSTVQKFKGDPESAAEDLKTAERKLRKCLTISAHNEIVSIDFRLAHNLICQARLSNHRRKSEDAAESAEQAINMLTGWADTGTSEEFQRSWKRTLAEAHQQRGEALIDQGQPRDASRHFQSARVLREELFKEIQDGSGLKTKTAEGKAFQRDLARSYGYLGDAMSDLGNVDKAREWYEKSRVIRLDLYKDDSDDPDVRFQYARALANFGYLEHHLGGNLEDARTRFEEVRGIRKDLVDSFGKVTKFREDYASCLEELGDIYLLSTKEQPNEAAELRKKAKISATDAIRVFESLREGENDTWNSLRILRNKLTLALVDQIERPNEPPSLEWDIKRLNSEESDLTLAMAYATRGEPKSAVDRLRIYLEGRKGWVPPVAQIERHKEFAFRLLPEQFKPEFESLLANVRSRFASGTSE